MEVVVFDASEAGGVQPRGWGRYAGDLARALVAAAPGDLEVRPVSRGAGRLPEVVWEQVGLPRRLRREGAALVHAPNWFLPLRRPCPGVVTVTDLAFEAHPEDFSARTGAKYRQLGRRAARSAERVIAVSQATADDLCERYGVAPERVRVVHPAPSLPDGRNGVRHHFGHAAPGVAENVPDPYSNTGYVLGVGDLRPKKNWVRLAEAMALGGFSQRLVIAGVDSGEGAAIRAAAGARVRVELPGYVDDAHLDALMRGADLLVHPSLYEGFGLVVVEAMARGVPVAIADTTSLPEAAGGAAETFDPLSVQDIARAIGDVLGSAARRDELVAAGRERVAALSWERAAHETLEVYREALVA